MTISYLLRPDRFEFRIYLDQIENRVNGPNRYEIRGKIPKKGLKTLSKGFLVVQMVNFVSKPTIKHTHLKTRVKSLGFQSF